MRNHQTSTQISRVLNATAAGTDDTVTSSGVDMAGFDTCEFVVLFGAITATAVTSVKAQQSSDNGSSDAYSDLEGTAVSIADDGDNGVVRLEIRNPEKRYLRFAVTRATANAVIDGGIAIAGGASNMPVDQHGTVEGNELHVTPAEGTA